MNRNIFFLPLQLVQKTPHFENISALVQKTAHFDNNSALGWCRKRVQNTTFLHCIKENTI